MAMRAATASAMPRVATRGFATEKQVRSRRGATASVTLRHALQLWLHGPATRQRRGQRRTSRPRSALRSMPTTAHAAGCRRPTRPYATSPPLSSCGLLSLTPTCLARPPASQIAMRIVSTNNLKKITSSMKMVSSAKMQADVKRLEAVKPFNEFAKTLCGPPVLCEDLDVSEWPEKNLVVAVSSDKGLCGGVNSFVARNMKKINAKLAADGKSMKVVVWGEKGRSQVTNARRNARAHERS